MAHSRFRLAFPDVEVHPYRAAPDAQIVLMLTREFVRVTTMHDE